MAKIDAAQLWSLNNRLLSTVITSVARDIGALGVEPKELFLLAAIDEHFHPAALATALSMPKPTVTLMLKRLEAGGLVRREIDAADLRRHRLSLTAAGRKTATRGMAVLSAAYGERLDRLTASERSALAVMLEKMS